MNNKDNTVEWLLSMEKTASALYQDMSKRIGSGAPDITDLLRSLSIDENMHYDMLKRVYGNNRRYICPLLLDGATADRIVHPIREYKEEYSKGPLTIEEVCSVVTRLEFSEWNEMFLYTMSTMSGRSIDHIMEVSGIDDHRRHITEHFRGRKETEATFLKHITTPTDWGNCMLAIEDSEPLAELIKSILAPLGVVDNVKSSGDDAYSRIKNMYYSVIITNIEKGCNKWSAIFQSAARRYPQIRSRFIFMVSADDNETMNYLRRSNLNYLVKPVPMEELRIAVKEVLERKDAPLTNALSFSGSVSVSKTNRNGNGTIA